MSIDETKSPPYNIRKIPSKERKLRVEEASERVGMPDFYHRDAHTLSGGETKRIALARAFLRKSPIIILDEPTSSMDSWSEMDWVKRFRQLASGRTAIIIAHRFTTAMQADIIHVMDKGRVVESGSHNELLALDGRYAASWKEQMRNDSDT